MVMRVFKSSWLVVVGLHLLSTGNGCIPYIKAEQRQIVTQLDREVIALKERNQRLSEQLEHCDDVSAPDAVYTELRQLLSETEAEVIREGSTTLLVVPGGLLFSPKSIRIRQEAAMVLDLLSVVLAKHQGRPVRVVGHVSNGSLSSQTRRKFPTHWELAAAQSAALVRHLVETHQLDASRFVVASRGSVEPVPESEGGERTFPDWRIHIYIDSTREQIGKPDDFDN